MDDEHKEELTAEELSSEQEALKEVQEDELRNKLAEDLGIDPDEEAELLDKVLARELSHRKKLSGAIKQKISWRDQVKKLPNKPTNTSEASKETPNVEELVDKKIYAALENRELKSLNLPEDVESEVKELSTLRGISVREAAQLPYIQSRIKEVEQEERIKAATPKRTNKGSYITNVDLTKPLNPADFDLDTEEGRKAWKEAKDARAKLAK